MRVAIPAKENDLEETVAAEHFGRCAFFVVATIENKEVVERKKVDNPYYKKHVPFAVPNFLSDLEPSIDVVITGGLGPRASSKLKTHNIEVISGASGTVKDVLDNYIKSNLGTAENPCNHV